MTEQDKAGFMAMMNTVTTIYSKHPLEKDAIRVWFQKLHHYDFQVVCKAFDTHTNESKHMPTPADIISLCRSKSPTFLKLPAPVDLEANKKHSQLMMEYIAQQSVKKNGFKDWAYRIIDNPGKYPKISLDFAQNAIKAK
ncbi:hypothetical protein EB001_14770 [bacterium]|nr:hypothetical protein [bacterium]